MKLFIFVKINIIQITIFIKPFFNKKIKKASKKLHMNISN